VDDTQALPEGFELTLQAMHCHLLIPTLFPPGANTPENDPLHGAYAPALESMLARGKRTNSSETAMESWLCERYGIPSQPGHRSAYPIAPISLLAEEIAPERAAWMRADPVFLTVERDQLILAEASSLPIDAHDAEALIDTLNRHFSEDGLEFVAATPKSWYLRLSRPPAIETHSLHEERARIFIRFCRWGRMQGSFAPCSTKPRCCCLNTLSI
jgi:hypothetical protein